MAARRGRPSKVERKQILKEGAGEIAKEFLRHPLRRPVDPSFEPYYQRILKKDLTAVSDYCEANKGMFILDGSFYELLGRLLFLGQLAPEDAAWAAANQIVTELARRSLQLLSIPDNIEEEYPAKRVR